MIWTRLTLLTALLLLALAGASAAVENRVLELDGTGGYIEMPPKMFTNLDQATVEAWVRWDAFGDQPRRVFNYGAANWDMSLSTIARRNLWFVTHDAAMGMQEIVVQNVLRAGEWCHVAAVSGPGGMKLYFNGVLLAEKPFEGSFSALAGEGRLFIGNRITETDPPTRFQGGLDEVRVWKTARTAEQIREHMSMRLTGREEDLALLLNFDDPSNPGKDSSPSGHHGKLVGAGQSIPTEVPRPGGNNRVLELDGNESYVELPAQAFAHLEEATVEGWIKWGEFRMNSRFFDFGEAGSSINVQNRGRSAALWFEVGDVSGSIPSVSLPNILVLDEWIHIAAVSGPSGMRLFLNGTFAGSHPSTNSVRATGGATNFLGRSNWRSLVPEDQDFRGQMDEVRVWNRQLSAREIGEAMNRKLTGSEPGLAALYKFDDGTARDSSTNQLHGRLMGNARTIVHQRNRSGIQAPIVLSGTVADAAGKRLSGALVTVHHHLGRLIDTRTDANGDFRMVLREAPSAVNVSAAWEGLGGWKQEIAFRQTNEVHLEFVLERANSIKGSVAALDGSPLGSVVLHLLPVSSSGQISPSLYYTSSDKAGAYGFTNIPPGNYQVRLNSWSQPVLHEEGKLYSVDNHARIEGVDFKIPPFRKGTWKKFGYLEGLGDNFVRPMIRAKDGRLWLPTYGGVSIYDGNTFETISTEDGLPKNQVEVLYEDRHGRIWAGFPGGIARVDQGVTNIAHLENRSESVTCITEDQQGTLWVGAIFRGAGAVYRLIDGKLSPVDALIPGGRSVWSIAPYGEKGMLVATFGGAFLWKDGKFSPFGGEAMAGHGVRSMLVLSEKEVWFGMYDRGLYLYDGEKAAVIPEYSEGPVVSIWRDSDGVMWFGDLGRFHRWNGKSWVIYDGDEYGFKTYVDSIFRDGDGQLWVGTEGDGLFQFDESTLIQFGTADGLESANTWRADNVISNEVWVTYGNQQADLARYQFSNLGNFRAGFQHSSSADGLPAQTILAIRTPSGRVFAGTLNGLAEYRTGGPGSEKGSFQAVHGIPGIIPSLIPLPDGDLWVGRWNLPPVVLGASGEVNERASAFWSNSPVRFAWDTTIYHNDEFWIPGGPAREGTGLWRVSGTNISHYGTTNGLPSDEVLAVQPAPNGKLWIATQAGVTEFDGREFHGVTRSTHGLGPGSVYCMFTDSRGLMWLGGRSSVLRYDGFTWTSLDERDGMDATEVRNIAETSDGAIWFGTARGVVRYASRERVPPAPLLTLQLDQLHEDASGVQITSGRLATIRFRTLDFRTAPEKKQFRYQIVPGAPEAPSKEDPKWINVGNRASIEWPAPSAGKYTVFVQAIDRDHRYSAPAGMTLAVVPPWYLNPWIAGPVGSAAFGLVGWAFVARMLYARKRREAEQLREEMLQREHAARTALEAKNAELALAMKTAEKARVAADAANQTKSQFLANMSHELRTPLNAILGYSEMVQEELQDRGMDDLAPDLEKIQAAARHQLQLVNDILDLSKIEAGKATLYLETFDLAPMLREVAATVQPLIAKSGNRLELDIPANLGVMRADQTKVRQVLFNLLSNANKFTEKGIVQFSVRPSSDGDPFASPGGRPARDLAASAQTIEFKIQDTGIGISPEQLSRLFQAFSQADLSTTRKYGGTGLGLAISRKFCQMMGGGLAVESKPGDGSTFTVTLPRESPGAGPEAEPPEFSRRAESSNGAADVLVIDDDPSVRDLMQRFLGKEGFAVRAAASGDQGLALARSLKPGAITLDIMMPGRDGWSVLSALKSDPELADIPVVLVTIVDDENMGFALGASDFVPKPIDWPRLITILNKHRRQPPGFALVVEDDPNTREIFQRNLEKHGWEVALAENGLVALERLAERVPSVILLDLMMPEMDGFEFMRALRRSETGRQVPVIVITAKELTDEDRRRLNGQVIQILQKGSFRAEELLSELRQALAETAGKY